MLDQTYAARSTLQTSATSGFALALAIFLICGPLLLVSYAFAFAPDAVERAQIVVQGLEAIIGVASSCLMLRIFYVAALAGKSLPAVARSVGRTAQNGSRTV